MVVTILSVAEKPSVAKELARIIGQVPPDTIKRPGHSPYNHIFDIPNCIFKEENGAQMRMTSVTGHLMELEFDPAFKGWNSCAPLELFGAPVHKEVKSENQLIKRTLQQEARQCNVLLLWLDCDLEGENIAYEVIQVCKEANPRLDVYRARFSALIDRDVLRTLRVPDRPNPHMNDAVEARQEIDLRIGAAFTRFQTLRLRKKFDNIGSSIISFGPCQFPTLGFVVERHLRIKAFQPQNFWSIRCEYKFENPDKPGDMLSCSFLWDRTRVFDRYACTILYEMCVEPGADGVAVVTHCQQRPTSRQKPLPLNTIDFQMRASRYLHMSSDRAMAVAESLYQRGVLSYPRTETNFFQDGIDLQQLLGEHRQHADWGQFATQLLDNGKYQKPRHGGKDDQAHPPIHPTKCVNLADLGNDEERKVYDLVARHFLACCATDARGSQTKIEISIPSPEFGEKFHATGLMVLERNWLDVYGKYESWHGSKVPVFKVGDQFQTSVLLMTEGCTAPPAPISESDLISIMDKSGIGTDATIAQHISTILTREYAVKNAQNLFEPTKLGLALVEGYNSMGYQLNKPQLRAVIESDCQKVAKGEASRQEVVQKCLGSMRECFVVCQREAGKLDASVRKYFSTMGTGPAAQYRTLRRRLSTCGVCSEGMDLREEIAPAEGANDDDGGGGGGNGWEVENCGGRNGEAGQRAAAGRGGGARGQGQGATTKRFLFCGRCSQGHLLPNKGDLQPHDVRCAICAFQVLTVRNPDTNKEHTVCPHCFSNPPAPPDGLADGSTEFRCFMCANADCALAARTPGEDVEICACAAGGARGGHAGIMKLRKTPKGFVISCSETACKAAWWLPKFVRSATPSADRTCTRCQQRFGAKVSMIQFSFVLSKGPPGLDPEATLCPCCDRLWDGIGHGCCPVKKQQQILLSQPRQPARLQQQQPQPLQQLQPRQGAPLQQLQQQLRKTGPDLQQQTLSFQPPSQNQVRGSGQGRMQGRLSGRSSAMVHDLTSPPNEGAAAMEDRRFGTNTSSSSSSCYAKDDGGGSSSSSSSFMMDMDVDDDYQAALAGRGTISSVQAAKRRTTAAIAPHSTYLPAGASSSSSMGGGDSSSYGSGGSGSSALFGSMMPEAPVCSCQGGLPSVIRTVFKDGPNKGRTFFACAKPREETCGFFQWTDEPSRGAAVSSSTGGGALSRGGAGYAGTGFNYGSGSNNSSSSGSSSSYGVGVSYNGSAGGSVDTANPVCGCSVPSVLRTVNKDGPNKGKTFFGCSNSLNGGCQFFQWTDEPSRRNSFGAAGGSATSSSTSSAGGFPAATYHGAGGGGDFGDSGGTGGSGSNNRFSYGSSTSGAGAGAGCGSGVFNAVAPPQCACGTPSICLVTRKEGPNFGRSFYVCSKQRDDTSRCDFFKWQDAMEPSPPSSSGSGNLPEHLSYGSNGGSSFPTTGAMQYGGSSNSGSGGGGSTSGGSGGGGGGNCFRCNQPGHFARECPNQ